MMWVLPQLALALAATWWTCSLSSTSTLISRGNTWCEKWQTLSWTRSDIPIRLAPVESGLVGRPLGSRPWKYNIHIKNTYDNPDRFWELAVKTATPTSQRRFIKTFGHYMDAIVQQAKDRTRRHIRGLDSYLEVRRDTIGAKPSFAILELEMDLPDDVFNHPILENLRLWVIDMLCIGNVSSNSQSATKLNTFYSGHLLL